MEPQMMPAEARTRLKALGYSEQQIEDFLENLRTTEKTAKAMGVRYKSTAWAATVKTALEPYAPEPGADLAPNIKRLFDALGALDDSTRDALIDQCTQQALQAGQATQDAKAAPAPLHHRLGDTEHATKTARGFNLADMFAQIAAEHRADAPPLSNQ